MDKPIDLKFDPPLVAKHTEHPECKLDYRKFFQELDYSSPIFWTVDGRNRTQANTLTFALVFMLSHGYLPDINTGSAFHERCKRLPRPDMPFALQRGRLVKTSTDPKEDAALRAEARERDLAIKRAFDD
ncbi:hypothetical protein [Vibrio phage VCPH]|nr:hypothetical protein [Vibrio phage VCPH]